MILQRPFEYSPNLVTKMDDFTEEEDSKMAPAMFFPTPAISALHPSQGNDADHDDDDDGEDTEDGNEEVDDAPEDVSQQAVVHHSQVDIGALVERGRRVTLKPRRTLSLSPTPARTGVMTMGHNMTAARRNDYTDKDDDDGLYPPAADSPHPPPPGGKSKGTDEGDAEDNTEESNNQQKRNIKGDSPATGTNGTNNARKGASVKRPYETTLLCQEIQYLDIPYQKVQYSPIPRKKIAYHKVFHYPIQYFEVKYYTSSDRPYKRKPLGRSHSIAAVDLG